MASGPPRAAECGRLGGGALSDAAGFRLGPPLPLRRRHPHPAFGADPPGPAPAGGIRAAVRHRLASDDPGTKMMVSVLAALLEFQRDMISEPGRPEDHPPRPRLRRSPQTARAARRHPGRPRRPSAHARPGRDARPARSARRHLRTAGDEAVRRGLDSGGTTRRSQGHSLWITALLELHRPAQGRPRHGGVETLRVPGGAHRGRPAPPAMSGRTRLFAIPRLGRRADHGLSAKR